MEEAAAEEKAWKEKENQLINWPKLHEEAEEWGKTLKLVTKDLRDREVVGIRKYGKALDPKTDDDMMQHLYEELLDAAMYIRTLIEQRKQS